MVSTEVDLQHWLRCIAEIAAAVNKPASLSDLLDLIARTPCELMGYEICAVFLPDRERGVLIIEGSYGLGADYIASVNSDHPIVIRGGEDAAPSSRAFLSREALQVSDISVDPAFKPWGGVAREQGFNSMISVPIIVSDDVLGTLNCYSVARHFFSDGEVALLSTLADQAGTAINSARWRADEERKRYELQQLNSSLETQHALLQQGEQIHQQFTDIALGSGGATAIAKALSALLHRPVVIEGQAGAVLARDDCGGPALNVPSPEEREHADPAGWGWGALPRGAIVEIPAWERADASVPWIFVPVSVGGETVAGIWLAAREKDLGPLDHRALEQASTVLILETLRSRAALDVEWRMSGEIVVDLIMARGGPVETIWARANRLGHDLSTPHAVVVIKADQGRHLSASRVMNAVRSVCDGIRPRPLMASVGEYIVALLPAELNDDSGIDDLKMVADRIRATVRRTQNETTVCVGISAVCSSPEDYPAAYRTARGAVEITRVRTGPDTTVEVSDLGVYGLLLQLDDPHELSRFSEQILGPLRNYDRERNTSLVDTLSCYLRHDLSTARAAEALYVHPNTITLRIRRIEALLDRSLADAEDVVQLTMAIMVDRVAAISD